MLREVHSGYAGFTDVSEILISALYCNTTITYRADNGVKSENEYSSACGW